MRQTERRLVRLERLARRQTGEARRIWLIEAGEPRPAPAQPGDLVIVIEGGMLPPPDADRLGG